MSWLTDLAGKAEDFLVKMDQSAAVALQKERDKSKNHSRQGSTASSVFSDISSSVGQSPPFQNDSALDVSTNFGHSSESSKDPILTNGEGSSKFGLQQENSLLKQELKSLNQELKQALQRARQADKDSKAAHSQLKSLTSALQSAEQQLMSLRSENIKLADQLLDKEAELATLRGKVEAVHVEQDHRAKLETVQQQLEEERKLRQTREQENVAKLSQLERERATFLSELQHCQQQLQSAKDEAATVHQSFNEYKQRAQRILQDKDKLLQDVKLQQRNEGTESNDVWEAELTQLKQERDLLREETAQVASQLQNLRKENAALELKYEDQVRTLKEKIGELESLVDLERNKKQQVESEVVQLNEELRFVRQDLSQVRLQNSVKIQQHEAELNKLRQQLVAKQSSSSSGEAELERRLRALTETLVAKQAALEAVQSERSSLMLQLERLEKELSNLTAVNSARPSHMNLNISDDAKSYPPQRSLISGSVSRRVRHAYSLLDSLNFQLGQALRRRPAARFFLAVYMVFLHFWVAFVLLTYTPEIHSH